MIWTDHCCLSYSIASEALGTIACIAVMSMNRLYIVEGPLGEIA